MSDTSEKNLFGAKFEFKANSIAGPSDQPDVAGGTRKTTSDLSPDADKTKRSGRSGVGVGELLRMVRGAIKDAMPRSVTVIGEVSNLSCPHSGHIYFSLKDNDGQIPAAMFRSSASKLKFRPTDGMEVLVTGRVDIYEAQGKLQLYVTRIEPRGVGSLELAFRQLREKLDAEGLFDPGHKRLIPEFPDRICVITSPTGAAVRDISRTLSRRWPAAEVFLIPVAVQGDAAAAQIARAVRMADAASAALGMDTLIVARGGGSLEDLWCFNEEVVARAVYDCRIPVISGVGHEVDTSICDMVADLRAATPTAAAEMAVPDREDYLARCCGAGSRMKWSVTRQLDNARSHLKAVLRCELFSNPLAGIQRGQQRLDEFSATIRSALIQSGSDGRRTTEKLTERLRWSLGALAKLKSDHLADMSLALAGVSPVAAVASERIRLDSRHARATTAMQSALRMSTGKLDHAAAMLEAMSYRKVLSRGFSVTRCGDGQILTTAAAAAMATQLETEFVDGRISSTINNTPPAPPAPPATPTPPPAISASPAATESSNKPAPAQVRRKKTAPDQPGLFDSID